MAAKLEKTKTPGIYKRGSRYVIVYRANGKQRWESYRTYDEARRAKNARHADVERGEFSPRSRVTLHEYAREWITRYHGRGRRGFRERTRNDYECQLEQYVLVYFSSRVRLTEITPQHVAKFISWLCDGRAQAINRHSILVASASEADEKPPAPLSPDAKRELSDATIRSILAPLRACLGSATREGLIRSNPTRDADLPTRAVVEDHDEEQVKALTAEQLEMFLRVVDRQHQLLFRVLASTGLRVSEAIGLQWQQLHLDDSDPHLRVRRAIVEGVVGAPKSKHARRNVPLSFELVRALREHRRTTKWSRDHDPVFSEKRSAVATKQCDASGSEARSRRGRCALGWLPHVPPYVRIHADRAGTQRRAGAAMARASFARVHALDLRTSDGRRGW